MTQSTENPADRSSPRRSARRTMPIVAIESISGRERLERQRLRPHRVVRMVVVMTFRLIPVALLLLLGLYVLTLW